MKNSKHNFWSAHTLRSNHSFWIITEWFCKSCVTHRMRPTCAGVGLSYWVPVLKVQTAWCRLSETFPHSLNSHLHVLLCVCVHACLCVKGFINVFLVFFYALFLHFPVCHWLSYIHTFLAAVYNLTLHIGFTASTLCYVNTIALLTLPKCHNWLLWWIRN